MSTLNFAIVFPGQGAQSLGMMLPYGMQNPVVRETFVEASEALGQDLWALMKDGPEADLNSTVNTQPLMLTADIAVWRLWRARGGPLPKIAAGHSLGEYAALVAAEVLSLPQAIRLVRLRATAMQQAMPAGTGAMAAVLGMGEGAIKALCEEISAPQAWVSVANFNAPEQFVVAGHRHAVDQLAINAKSAGAKRVVMLPVSAPFHCPLIKSAADVLARQLAEEEMAPPIFEILHNFDVAPRVTASAIRQALAEQVYHPVRWIETIEVMAKRSITHVVECGPGRVLTGLTRRIVSSLEGVALIDEKSVQETVEMLNK